MFSYFVIYYMKWSTMAPIIIAAPNVFAFALFSTVLADLGYVGAGEVAFMSLS